MIIWASLTFGLLLVTAACIFVYGNKPRILEHRARKTVVVTTRRGESFRGVLYDSDAHYLALRSAEALSDAPVPVDGELLVERDGATIQIP